MGASLTGSPQATPLHEQSKHQPRVSGHTAPWPHPPPPPDCLAPELRGEVCNGGFSPYWGRLFFDELKEQAHCSLKYQPLKTQVTIFALFALCVYFLGNHLELSYTFLDTIYLQNSASIS